MASVRCGRPGKPENGPGRCPQKWRKSQALPGTCLSLEIRGQYEAEVSRVQDRLNALGYGPIPVDGDFGPVTDSVVRQHQADHGLVVDGKVGPQTWE
ncbi:MAG: peptidoglycan-binding protein [Acidothermales bacterium]|nr:peptidoglycan-binding protein [Acidothermales bacterium]